MRVTYNWLKEFVDIRLSDEELAEKLTMAGLEVMSITKLSQDLVFDIEITANRPDLLSVLGIAREVSAIIDMPIRLPREIKDSMSGAKGKIKIEIEDKRLCRRYVGRIIRDVKIGPSPRWLQERLSMVGLRPVNNIVDITNYILIEMGQPLHAFDLDKIEGGKIIVRRAKKLEKIVSIDGVERELDSQILVIADRLKPIAIAGIMGGKDSEIIEATKNILLESAYFDPYFIRQASRKLGLASESSYRFERGVDPAFVLAASIKATKLIEKLTKGCVYGRPIDIGELPKRPQRVSVSFQKTNKVLGMDIPVDTQKELLRRLGFSKIIKKKGLIHANIPAHRRDIKYEIDLIEEIARLHRYERILQIEPRLWLQKRYLLENRYLDLEDQIRRLLTSLGLNEVLSYSLISRQNLELIGDPSINGLRIKNPLSLQQEFLRVSLLPECLELLSFNLNQKNEDLRLFEIGRVYLKHEEGFLEKGRLSIAFCGVTQKHWKEKSREHSFFDLKGVLEVLFRELGIEEYRFVPGNISLFKEHLNCEVLLKNSSLGVAGEVRKDILNRFDIERQVFLCELDLEMLLNTARLEKAFKGLPRFPSIRRDLAVVADESIFSSQIIDLVREIGGELVKAVDVFDLYYGEQIPLGKKGLALSIEYRQDTKTLRDEEVSMLQAKVCETLIKRFGVEVRK